MKTKKIRVAVGGDHAGFSTKSALVEFLAKSGCEVLDVGTFSEESCDYPDIALSVAKAVASGRCDRGVLACGTGIGMAIAANKVKGIRAGTAWNPQVAALSAEHNWSNVLCVPSRFVKLAVIKASVKAWLKTPFARGGRHQRRVQKIMKIQGLS